MRLLGISYSYDNEKEKIDAMEHNLIDIIEKHKERELHTRFDNYPLHKKECIVVIDIIKEKVLYAKGFSNILGFDDVEITKEFFEKNLHPDDVDKVFRIGKAALMYCVKSQTDCSDFLLLINYRRKKKDGSYIKVLSHTSAYEIDKMGMITKLFVNFTDISFMDKSNVIEWRFEVSNLNMEMFRKKIYKAYKDFFTKREKQMIKFINNGLPNKEIAKILFISHHTVKTHRKKIFKKANCHNKEQLLVFCNDNGII